MTKTIREGQYDQMLARMALGVDGQQNKIAREVAQSLVDVIASATVDERAEIRKNGVAHVRDLTRKRLSTATASECQEVIDTSDDRGPIRDAMSRMHDLEFGSFPEHIRKAARTIFESMFDMTPQQRLPMVRELTRLKIEATEPDADKRVLLHQRMDELRRKRR